MILQILGIVIAVAVAIQVVVTVLSLLREQKMSRQIVSRVVADARARARAARERDETARAQSELSWTGYRKFVVRRREVEDAAQQICSFYLEPHDRRPLPEFKPGQFLTFQLSIEAEQSVCSKCGSQVPPGGRFCGVCGSKVGATARSRPSAGKATVRCYSLSDCHNSSQYRVSIKRVPPPRDKPDVPPGLASNYFHNFVQEGDIMDVMAPSGGFHLDLKSERPVVLIGGGVGITPVLSMLNAITAAGSTRETWLFYGVRNGAEVIHREHLKALERDFPNVSVKLCYSDPRTSASPTAATSVIDPTKGSGQPVAGVDRPGDYDFAERVSVDLMRRTLPSNNYEFYICGPPPMMDAVVSDLEKWGVPTDDIHFEAFGPATVKRTSKATQVRTAHMATAKTVSFSRSGKKCVWTGSSDSLLDFAEENGVALDSGCRVGNCGTCLTAIKEGEVELLRDPDSPPEKGSCLTCISIPKGDLILDA